MVIRPVAVVCRVGFKYHPCLNKHSVCGDTDARICATEGISRHVFLKTARSSMAKAVVFFLNRVKISFIL